MATSDVNETMPHLIQGLEQMSINQDKEDNSEPEKDRLPFPVVRDSLKPVSPTDSDAGQKGFPTSDAAILDADLSGIDRGLADPSSCCDKGGGGDIKDQDAVEGLIADDSCQASEEEFHSASDGECEQSTNEVSFPYDGIGSQGTKEAKTSTNDDKQEETNDKNPSCDYEMPQPEVADNISNEDKSECNKIENTIVDDENYRQTMEDALTDEERQDRKVQGQKMKEEGNELFRKGSYAEALTCYTEALEICPLVFLKERAVMFSNRAACRMKEEDYDEAIKDCSKAIELHPHYVKAVMRRADLYEKKEKLEDALKDHQRILELDPSQHASRAACMRLPEMIKERNEKLKEEMLGKLKDLGNLVLRPFGLSTNNFKLQQDPATGSYSVQFMQNPPTNGK